NVPIRTRILEFGFLDVFGTAGVLGSGTPGVIPALGGTIVGGVRQIQVSSLTGIGGLAVDDNGSLYYHLADLIQFTGGAIFKNTELPHATCGGAACISRVLTPLPAITSINQWQNTPGTNVVNPLAIVAGARGTNYSGPSTLFG